MTFLVDPLFRNVVKIFRRVYRSTPLHSNSDSRENLVRTKFRRQREANLKSAKGLKCEPFRFPNLKVSKIRGYEGVRQSSLSPPHLPTDSVRSVHSSYVSFIRGTVGAEI